MIGFPYRPRSATEGKKMDVPNGLGKIAMAAGKRKRSAHGSKR
jgi:hypothetical protein